MSRPDGYPDDWDIRRRRVYARDAYRCNNCGVSDTEVHAHHIVPLSKGGSNDLSNLTTLCTTCHTLIHPHMQEPTFAAASGPPGAAPGTKEGLAAFAENAAILIGGGAFSVVAFFAVVVVLGLMCRAIGWEPDPCSSAPADAVGDCRDRRYDTQPDLPNKYDDYVPPSDDYVPPYAR